MSELTNIHARSVKDLTTPTELPANPDALDQVKLVAGNFPAEYTGNEALTVKQIKDIAADHIESKVEVTLSNLSTTANKFYPTLSEANNHLATMSVNDVVTIGEEANKGLWYKATAGATTLTKSAYDPLTQANNYTNNKAIATKTEAVAIANNYTDLVFDAVPATIAPYVAQAEAAATAAAISAGVFETPEAGVDPTTGVNDGEYFNVRSPSSDSYIDEYQNIGGVATPSGKSYPSSAYVQDVASYTVRPFIEAKVYPINARVLLKNGDIVKSTIGGNTNDPNVNMTGWVNIGNTGGVESIAEMLAIRNPKNGNRVFAVGYYAGSLLGGGEFIYSKTSTLAADQGIVFDCPDGGKWIRLHKGQIDFYAYGAKFDGITDDTQAITNALKNEYYKHIQHYEDGVAIITASTAKMPKGMTVRMGESAWIKINNPAGNIMCFLPADDCELKVNIEGGQLPLSGDVGDEWIGSNNFGIFTTTPDHGAASFANINVKNVKITGSKFKNIASPVRADGSDNWDISGNYFHKIKQSGVLMGASANGGVYRNKVHHNTFIELGDTAAAAYHINGLPAKSGQIECISMTDNYVRNSQLRTGGCPFDFEGVVNVGESFGHLIANNIVEQLDTRPLYDLKIRGMAICGKNVKDTVIKDNVHRGSGASNLGPAVSIGITTNCTVSGNYILNQYGGGVSITGSKGATVCSNIIIDSQGSSISSPAIRIAVNADAVRTSDFTVVNNTIVNTDNYIRTGESSAIALNFTTAVDALNLNGVISGNTIRDPNGTAISVTGSVAEQVSGVDISGNSVFSKYDTLVIDVTRAKDINVSGLYARGGRGIKVFQCIGGSVRLSDMDLKVNGLLFEIGGCLNLNISDSKVFTSSASIFSDTGQFIDATKNNRLVNVTGTINSENKGRGVYRSVSTPISHGLTLPPKGINMIPLTAGVTGLRVYGMGSQYFYVEYGGVVDAEFMWSASI